MTTALAEFSVGYETDKFGHGRVPHHYDALYDPLFAPLRDKPVRLLEIGIFYGESMKLWRDYFPKGKIFGIDIELPPPIPGVTMFQGDQGDTEFLERVAKEAGPFDIIIDDASHVGKLTTASFRCLHRHLAPGGIYAVEDLGAELSPRFHDTEPFTRTGLNEVLLLAQFVRRTWKEIRVMPSLMVFVKEGAK